MTRSMLPPLHDTAGVPALAAAGKWESSSHQVLDDVADGLESRAAGARFANIVSVPDVWAQTEVFGAALLHASHPLHVTAVSEWRGLLTLLATSDLLGLPVTTMLLNLETLGNNFGKIAGDPSVLPTHTLSATSSWSQISVIQCGGQTAGLVTPATFVCPAATSGIPEELAPFVPWYRDGSLVDPLLVDAITEEELACTAAYATGLHDLVQTIQQPVSNVTGPLAKLLAIFADACRSRCKSVDPSRHFIATANPGIEVPDDAIFTALRKIPRAELAAKPVTHVPARADIRSLKPDTNGIVAIDAALGETAGHAWLPYSIKLIERGLNERATANLRDVLKSKGYIPVNVAGTFFTNKLVKVDSDTPITGHPSGFENYILPLMPRALLYLFPQQIKDSLSITHYDQKVTITLEIPIGGQPVNFERTYSEADDEIIEVAAPSSIAAWPGLGIPGYSGYYLYYGGNPEVSFQIGTPFSTQMFEARFGKAKFEDAMQKSVDFSTPDSVTKVVDRQAQVLREVYRFNAPVEALVCRGERDLNLGVLLIPDQQVFARQQADWQVGIDFGTSNTTIYCRRDDQNPEPVSFSGQLTGLVSLDSTAEDELELEFVPADQVSAPFLTVFQDRIYADDRPGLLLSGNIYYRRDVRQRLGDLTKPGSQALHFNLKWGDRPGNNDRISTFMEQAITQTLVELTRRGADPQRIRWNFSYPTAFSRRQLGSYRMLVRQALQHAGARPEFDMREESLSTALFFGSNHQAWFTQSVVTVDVGGHTSDIAIWQDSGLLWQGSVEFAAQHIFTKFLAHNHGFFDKLLLQSETEEAKDIFARNNADDPTTRNAIEAIVNSDSFRAQFASRLPKLHADESVTLLAEVAQLALAGLVYYFGMVIRRLHEDQNFDMKLVPLKICFGGQGSLLWRQLDEAKLIDTDNLAALLADVVQIDSQIEFSMQPKHEVAYGLLVDPKGSVALSLEAAMTENIGGERLQVGTETVEPQRSVESLKSLDDRWEVDERLPVLSDFLKRYRDLFGNGVPLDRWRHDLCGEINGFLADQKDRIREDRKETEGTSPNIVRGQLTESQPVFLAAIRFLVARLCRSDD